MVRIIVYSIISTACLVGAILQFMQKGIPFTNEFNFESKDIKNQVDKKPFFIQGGTFLLYLAFLFIVILIQEVKYMGWLDVLFKISLPLFIIYAIISSVKLEKLKKNVKKSQNTGTKSLHGQQDDENKFTIILLILIPFIVAFLIIVEAFSEV